MKHYKKRPVLSFRPLAGFWFLNFLKIVTAMSPYPCFRPLAGFWFLNIVKLLEANNLAYVSVPLRGSGS